MPLLQVIAEIEFEGRARAMQIISKIISNVLTALYQPFWFAVILSVLFMFVYKAYPSIKQAAKDWISWFRKHKVSGANKKLINLMK